MKVPILHRLRSLSSIDRSSSESKDNEEMKHDVSLDFASAPNSPTTHKQPSPSPSTPKITGTTSSSSSSTTSSSTDSKKSNKLLSPPTPTLKSSLSSSSMKSTPSSSVKNTPRHTPQQTPRGNGGKTPREGGSESLETGSLPPIGENSFLGGEGTTYDEDEYPKSSSFFSKFISNTFSSFSMPMDIPPPDYSPPVTSRPSSRAPSAQNTPNFPSQGSSRSTSRRQSAIQL